MVSPVEERFFAPRLGENLAAAGVICGPAEQRAEECLRQALELCRAHRVERPRAAATAAVREARNGREFVARLRDRLALEVEILDEREEARLGYLGAVSAVADCDALAVVDVGGGSTECSVGIGRRYEKGVSAPIGAVRLTDRFGRSPSRSPAAMETLRAFLAPAAALARGRRLIAVGGSATTAAAVTLGLERYDGAGVSRCRLTSEGLAAVEERFRSLTLDQLRELPGMEPSRADIIEAGTTILRVFLESAGAGSMAVSDRGLRHGLLLRPVD